MLRKKYFEKIMLAVFVPKLLLTGQDKLFLVSFQEQGEEGVKCCGSQENFREFKNTTGRALGQEERCKQF